MHLQFGNVAAAEDAFQRAEAYSSDADELACELNTGLLQVTKTLLSAAASRSISRWRRVWWRVRWRERRPGQQRRNKPHYDIHGNVEHFRETKVTL